jgi:hypothetical protein
VMKGSGRIADVIADAWELINGNGDNNGNG